jgi:type I restriction enzyme, S subunit
MTDGLKPKQRDAIIAKLSVNPKVERVVLFGSRAMGTFTPTSDIDIALFGSDLTLSDQAALSDAMAELSIPHRVDILVHHRIESQALREHIRKHGVEWFARKRPTLRTSAMECYTRPFGELFAVGTRNGLTRPKAVRGSGVKMVNMGELFAHPRMRNVPMDRVPLSEAETERFLLKSGDLLFARQSLVLEGAGKCSIFLNDDEPVTFESHVTRVRLDSREADPLFYFYYLQSHHGRVAIRSIVEQGAGASGIRGSDLGKLRVMWRSVPEQQAIACILGGLDDKIELNRAMSRTLEATARAIFKSWFVDFDPVRAKAAGQQPHGFKPEIAALFPDSFEDSELGNIPRGWSAATFGDIAEQSRRTVRPNNITPETPYIALEHMPKRCIALSDWATADGLESNKFAFRKGDILFGKLRPYFHKVGVAPVDGVCSTDIVVVQPKAAERFGVVLGHLSSLEFVEHTNAGSTGTKMPRTSWGEMARYRIVCPPDTIAKAFTGLVRPWIDRIIAGIHEARTLAALRDSMLPKLISGELRVREAVRIVGRAV